MNIRDERELLEQTREEFRIELRRINKELVLLDYSLYELKKRCLHPTWVQDDEVYLICFDCGKVELIPDGE